MHNYINCIAHKSSDGNILIGEKFTALFDCGMAFCAEDTIRNVKGALKGRTLDYIFLTHTHYDHVGALMFFKNEWKNVQVITSEIGASILQKSTPRKVIYELSLSAAKSHCVELDMIYPDNCFRADAIVKDGDYISLGGNTINVVETPGHTRDTLSFFCQ